MTVDAYPLVWHWKTRPIGNPRKGQRCRVVARGGKNSVLVEFPDGYTVVTCRHAVRKVVPSTIPGTGTTGGKRRG